MTVVRTTEELRLDILTRDLLGTEKGGRVEALLSANQGLAALGPYVPAAAVLTVPAIDASPVVAPSVNPWE